MNYTEEYLAPIKALITDAGYDGLLSKMVAVRGQYRDDPAIGFHLNALCDIMPRLTTAVTMIEAIPQTPTPPPAPVSAPEGTETPAAA